MDRPGLVRAQKPDPVWASAAGREQQGGLRRYLWQLHPVATAIAFLLINLSGIDRVGPIVVITLAYTVGLAVVRFAGSFSNTSKQFVGLAFLDVITIATVAVAYPEFWRQCLVTSGLIVSMGWAESKRVTGVLLAYATVLMGIAGAVHNVEYWLLGCVLFAVCTASISVTAMWSASEQPLNAVGESLDSVRAMVWQAEETGEVTEIVGPVEFITGLTPTGIIGRPFTVFLGAKDFEFLGEWSRELTETGSVSCVHSIGLRADAAVRSSLRLVKTKTGKTEIHGVTVDISKAWAKGEEQRRQASVIQHMRDGLIILGSDPDGTIRVDRLNVPATRILGLSEFASWQELVNSHPSLCDRISLDLPEAAEDRWRYEVPDSNDVEWTAVHTYQINDEAMAVQLTDISREVADEARILHDANHDGLTGLLNAAEFRRRMTERLTSPTPITVFLLDLNQFKPVNDAHGHAAGDVVLRTIAQRLRNSLKADDQVARLGGDEFVGFLDGTTLPEEIERTRIRIETACSEPVLVNDDLIVEVSASLGYATRQPGDSPADLLARADREMYARKAIATSAGRPGRA